jgi:translation initiation factor IF-1
MKVSLPIQSLNQMLEKLGVRTGKISNKKRTARERILKGK